jgi:hypothetical protein
MCVARNCRTRGRDGVLCERFQQRSTANQSGLRGRFREYWKLERDQTQTRDKLFFFVRSFSQMAAPVTNDKCGMRSCLRE